MTYLLIAVLVLSGIALVASIALYVVSKKFAVKEDPRIADVQQILPGANCGGCGFPGCSGMASALVKAADAGSLGDLSCPVGGAAVMKQVSDALGVASVEAEPKIAVVRCQGSCEFRPKVLSYDGHATCYSMHAAGCGESLCGYGCLGCGDCVTACQFDAIHINPETHLPEVDADKCTACGNCAKVCPRHIIEIRKRGPKDRRVFVACMNKDKGPDAKKACQKACIGCKICEKECKFEAIHVDGNLSYIDAEKCRLCRKCEAVCPTGAIKAVNFPPRKMKEATAEEQFVKSKEA